MRRLILLIAIVLFYTACNQNKLPKGVIEKDEMLNVMLDMQLTDASLNQVFNNDTMKMYANSRYNYLFKKYNIDSATFSNSLKYYSMDPVELDSMYSLVSDSLTRLAKILAPKIVNNTDSLRMNGYKTYSYMFGKFKRDSINAINNFDSYDLNGKALLGAYHRGDSLAKPKDSLNVIPKKFRQLKKATKIKNDLSAK